MGSYSSDMLKRAALIDELNNVLSVEPVENRDEEWISVEQYVRRRIKEIEKVCGS